MWEGKKKEDKIIPGCYVDLPLIVAFLFFFKVTMTTK